MTGKGYFNVNLRISRLLLETDHYSAVDKKNDIAPGVWLREIEIEIVLGCKNSSSRLYSWFGFDLVL